MKSLVPTSFADYSLDFALQIGRDVSVSARPAKSGVAMANVTWSVHDRKTAASAKSFITKTSKSAYSHNGASVTVGGTTGYFGTDGTKFATVSFVRGRYAYEIIATAPGNSPADMKNDALRAAAAFPALPSQ
jgi:hypothetical protein